MMAYRHGFLVSVLCLIFLLNIHSTALKFVPVFYKSMHLPIIQFSWHGLGSSDYTKQEYFSARAWIYEHWSFDIWIWLNCGVPRDSRSWSGTNCLALATMDSIWSSSHRCKQRHKRRDITKRQFLLQQLHCDTRAIDPEWWYFYEPGPSTNSDIKHPEVKTKNKFQAKNNEMWLLWEDDKKKTSKHNLLCFYWVFPPEMFRPDSLLLYLVMQ